MLAKQLKMSLLQVFSDITTQRRRFGHVADEQACVFGSCAFNKHCFKDFHGLNFQTV